MSPGADTGRGSAAIADAATALEACAAAFVKEHRLPGASVAVVHGDGLAWSAGIGLCDAAAGRTADDATLYRVASVTKTFTGTAIMQLRDEGRLDLDDPVVAHAPEPGVAEGNRLHGAGVKRRAGRVRCGAGQPCRGRPDLVHRRPRALDLVPGTEGRR